MENVRSYAKLAGLVLLTATAVGILANWRDIKRYIRISTM